MTMSQRPRHVTLRRLRDAPNTRNGYNTPNKHNTQQKFRNIPIETTPVLSETMARFPRWPKNVFFASDFIADRIRTAAAPSTAAATSTASATSTAASSAASLAANAGAGAVVAGAAWSSANPRHTIRESMHRGGAASRPRDGVGTSNMDRPFNRRYVRRASGASASEPSAGDKVEVAQRPGDKRVVRMAQEGFALEDRAKSGNRSTIYNKNATHKVPAVVGKEEALFLEESASALLFLHSRFFRGVHRDEDLVCRLCMLCKEAGWMGNPRGMYSGLDPLVLDRLLAERLEAKKWRTSKRELQCLDCPDRHHRPAAGVLEFSFEDFYQTLADIACLVYPREANNEGGDRSGRAMHRLLLEGVLPLAAGSKPRVWSPRPEVLYGRPALIALRAQRDSLHELYCSYSNKNRARAGATGIRRHTFLRMLRELGASPGSVSDARAKAVFDAVLRNGLPETPPNQQWRDSKSHHVMTNGWVAGGSNGNVMVDTFQSTGRKEVSDKAPISGRGRLCWTLFLEAMAALAVEAVEDRHGMLHGTAKRKHDQTVYTKTNSAVGVSSQSRHRDPNGGDHRLREQGITGHREDKDDTEDKEENECPPRRGGSRLSSHSARRLCRLSGAVRCGEEERSRELNDGIGRQRGSEKRRHKATLEQRKLAPCTDDVHATAGHAKAGHAKAGHAKAGHVKAGLSSTNRDGQLHWRGSSCELDDNTRKMELMPTLPESNELQENQAGVPARHRFSPQQHVLRQCYESRGKSASAMPASKPACARPDVAAISRKAADATAAPEPLVDDALAVAPKGGPQRQSVEILADEVHVKTTITNTMPRNGEQKQSAASPGQDLPQPLHTGGDQSIPFGNCFRDGGGDSGAQITRSEIFLKVDLQERPMREKLSMRASMHVLDSDAAADGLTKVAAPGKYNNSPDERFISKKSLHERPKILRERLKCADERPKSLHDREIGRRDQTEGIIVSDQNQLERAIKPDHICTSNGVGCAGCAGCREIRDNDDLEKSTGPQCTSGRNRVHTGYLPSTGGLSPFSIAEDRAQRTDEDIADGLRTPAPCHGGSTSALASNAKPGRVKGAKKREVTVKPVAPQAYDPANEKSYAANAVGGVHPTKTMMCLSGINSRYAGPEANSSSAPCEVALNFSKRCMGTKPFEGFEGFEGLKGTALTEVVRAAGDDLGYAATNNFSKQAPAHHDGASTGQAVAPTINSSINTSMITGDASAELAPAADATVGASDATVRAADATVGAANATVGAADATVGAAGATVGAADATVGATDTTVGAIDATVGAAGCTTVIFQELLDPKVVGAYSRYREQLTRLFRRYSTGPNDTEDNCSREAIGCVQDRGMRQFVNDFPSLGGWVEGKGIRLDLQMLIRASSDRGWRRLKGDPGVDCKDMPRGGASGLCYLGFLEVLTRMAHANRGNSPTHEKLLSMITSLTADDPRRIL